MQHIAQLANKLLINMFRHQGKHRTYLHNLQIASLLSFVAGLVNVVGFLAIQKLTTNVTGHFAYFIDESFNLHGSKALVYFLYTLFFLLGAFFSELITQIGLKKNERQQFVIPVSLEIALLAATGFFGPYLIQHEPDFIAYLLLFAMGLQNALVTSISNAVVRTTHLTGLFTDLGRELAQFLFPQEENRRNKLKSSILLRFTIINFFFLGGISGGFLFLRFHIHAIYTAPALLLAGLLADYLKLSVIKAKRKLTHHK